MMKVTFRWSCSGRCTPRRVHTTARRALLAILTLCGYYLDILIIMLLNLYSEHGACSGLGVWAQSEHIPHHLSTPTQRPLPPLLRGRPAHGSGKGWRWAHEPGMLNGRVGSLVPGWVCFCPANSYSHSPGGMTLHSKLQTPMTWTERKREGEEESRKHRLPKKGKGFVLRFENSARTFIFHWACIVHSWPGSHEFYREVLSFQGLLLHEN